MSLLPLVALSLLAAGEPSSLPPGHPQLNAEAPAQVGALPANHPPLAGGGAPDAQELMRKLEQVKGLKDQPKPFEVAHSIGRLYYAAARYPEAADYFAQAVAKGEPARKLYLEQRKKAQAAKQKMPSPEGVGCEPGADQKLEELVKKAQERAGANDAAGAAMCARVALIPVLEAEMLRGKALFLSGDARDAVADFTRVLEVSEGDAEALYARGNARLDAMGDDVKALELAKKDFAMLAGSGKGPKSEEAKKLLGHVDAAIAAGGITRLSEKKAAERRAHPVQVAASPAAPMANAPFAGGGAGGTPPQLTQEMVDAVRNTERTPELAQGLGKLVDEAEEHLAHGRFQEALDNYKRVVPYQPDNGRAKAGMAWALVGLNKQPMAERIWGVAVNADAKAVDGLGDALKAKGDAKGAQALWTKLATSAPDYARSANLTAKLK